MGAKDLILSVKMLGTFSILLDGESVLSYLGNSTKSVLLLKYLIFKRGKPTPFIELIDTFWAECDKSANPENALKTMVSRIRSNMAKVNPLLKNCICSDKGAYYWNPEIACDVDVFRFEALCEELHQTESFDEKTRAKYIEVVSIYSGDLSYTVSDEGWVISCSLYLHRLYQKTVHRLLAHLREREDYETIIQVCRAALDIDILDETFNLALMEALTRDGQNYAALMQYRHIINTYYKYLGVEPSEQILNFFKNIMKTKLSPETNINTIKNDLRAIQVDNKGAFFCDYSIFRDIYSLQLRNTERQKNKIFLLLLTVSNSQDEPLEPLLLDGVMSTLMHILKTCLRKGDTISRYSPAQFVILMPMINYSSGNIVFERIRKVFYRKYTTSAVRLSFQLRHIDEDDMNE